jgi:hypothetical protein
MTRLSERDLTLPALLVLNEAHADVSTTRLVQRLRDLLKPTGEDLEILAGRQDDKFSQKVRNLGSHKTLQVPGYATYERRGRQGYWRITEFGQRLLTQSSDLIKIILEPGFSSSMVARALGRLDYTDPKRMPRVLVFGENEMIREGVLNLERRGVYERSKKLRDAAIAHYASEGDLQCEVRKFSFEKTYGELGAGFIEIHHKKPLFCLEGQNIEQTVSRAIGDVAALCANCHRMVHRERNTVLSVEQLRFRLRCGQQKQEALDEQKEDTAPANSSGQLRGHLCRPALVLRDLLGQGEGPRSGGALRLYDSKRDRISSGK